MQANRRPLATDGPLVRLVVPAPLSPSQLLLGRATPLGLCIRFPIAVLWRGPPAEVNWQRREAAQGPPHFAARCRSAGSWIGWTVDNPCSWTPLPCLPLLESPFLAFSSFSIPSRHTTRHIAIPPNSVRLRRGHRRQAVPGRPSESGVRTRQSAGSI